MICSFYKSFAENHNHNWHNLWKTFCYLFDLSSMASDTFNYDKYQLSDYTIVLPTVRGEYISLKEAGLLFIYFLYCCQLEIWAGCLYHHCPYWCLPFLWNVLHVCKTFQTPRFTGGLHNKSGKITESLVLAPIRTRIQRMLRNWLEIFFTRQNATVAQIFSCYSVSRAVLALLETEIMFVRSEFRCLRKNIKVKKCNYTPI